MKGLQKACQKINILRADFYVENLINDLLPNTIQEEPSKITLERTSGECGQKSA